MTGLALFIILLAFFIMLSGMSGFSKERADVVMDSVRSAFGIPNVVYFGGDGRAVSPGGQSTTGRGTAAVTLEDVAKNFEHDVPGVRAVLIRRTGVLQIDLPINQMNGLVGGLTDGRANPALSGLIQFVTAPERRPYHVQIWVHHRDGMDVSKRSMATELFLPFWVQKLTAMGLPERVLQVGVKPGPPGTIGVMVIPVAEKESGAK